MNRWTNRTHVGDCRSLLREMAAEGIRVQACVTSPPYFGLRDYGSEYQIGTEESPSEYIEQLVQVFSCVRDVLAHDGTLWINLGDSYANDLKWGGSTGGKHQHGLHGKTGVGRRRKTTGLKPKDLIGIPWRVALALQQSGWWLRSDIIWHKPNCMPESVTDRPTRSHEYLFLLAKSEKYYYDSNAIKEPAIRAGALPGGNGHYIQHSAGGRNRDGLAALGRKRVSESRNRRSVWTIGTSRFAGAHFATFPRKLIEPCVLAGTRPGDTVLDPFMGSGTTALVAQALGRPFIGCELNPAYIDLQSRRTANVCLQQSQLGLI